LANHSKALHALKVISLFLSNLGMVVNGEIDAELERKENVTSDTE
jgi:hypothetical protein